MGDVIGAIFGGGPKETQPQGPSAEELAAQKKSKDLVDARNRRETSESATRNRIITAQASGPQTLFTRPGSIPKSIKLGGGSR